MFDFTSEVKKRKPICKPSMTTEINVYTDTYYHSWSLIMANKNKPLLLSNTSSESNFSENMKNNEISIVVSEDKDEESEIPMWRKLTSLSANNKVVPQPNGYTSNQPSKTKKKSVIRASKTMTNQEFLALAVIEGNLENVLTVIKAYDELFGDRGFEIIIKKFLYDIQPETMLVSLTDEDLQSTENENYEKLSILHLTCVFDQVQIMKYFLRYGIRSAQMLNEANQSLIHTCAYFGSPMTMNLLIRNGFPFEERNVKGKLPLHLAAFQGNEICLQALLKEAENPNERDYDGYTALHIATQQNHLKSTQELLKYETVSYKYILHFKIRKFKMFLRLKSM